MIFLHYCFASSFAIIINWRRKPNWHQQFCSTTTNRKKNFSRKTIKKRLMIIHSLDVQNEQSISFIWIVRVIGHPLTERKEIGWIMIKLNNFPLNTMKPDWKFNFSIDYSWHQRYWSISNLKFLLLTFHRFLRCVEKICPKL